MAVACDRQSKVNSTNGLFFAPLCLASLRETFIMLSLGLFSDSNQEPNSTRIYVEGSR